MNKAKWLIGCGVIGIIALFAYTVFANQQQTWTWNLDTDQGVVGFRLYSSNVPCLNTIVDPKGQIVGPPIADLKISSTLNPTMFIETTVPDGVIATCNAMTAYSATGLESAQSPKVEHVFPVVAPPITPVLTVSYVGIQNPTSVDPWNVTMTSNIVGAYTSDVYVNGVFHHTDTQDPRCVWRLGTPVCSGGTVAKPVGVYFVEFRAMQNGVELVRKAISVSVVDPPPPPAGLVISQATADQVVVQCAKTDCSDVKVSTAGSGSMSKYLVRTLTRVK